MFRITRKHIVYKEFKANFKEFIDKFCFIPALMTGIGLFIMVYLKMTDITLVPFIFLGSFFGYTMLRWFVFPFDIKKDLHEGDE